MVPPEPPPDVAVAPALRQAAGRVRDDDLTTVRGRLDPRGGGCRGRGIVRSVYGDGHRLREEVTRPFADEDPRVIGDDWRLPEAEPPDIVLAIVEIEESPVPLEPHIVIRSVPCRPMRAGNRRIRARTNARRHGGEEWRDHQILLWRGSEFGVRRTIPIPL